MYNLVSTVISRSSPVSGHLVFVEINVNEALRVRVTNRRIRGVTRVPIFRSAQTDHVFKNRESPAFQNTYRIASCYRFSVSSATQIILIRVTSNSRNNTPATYT